MKRLLTSALAAALVVAGAAGDARAQDDMVGRRASLFDLGIYAGGAYSTDWFSAGDEGWNTGLAPIFGLTAAYWLSPSFGVRVHGAYFPSHLPEEEEFFGDDGDRWLVNNWLYDLDLVYRPFFWSAGSAWMSSLYLFLGGGGYTANIGGQHPYPGCLPVAVWVADGVCVSDSPTMSTTGQGVLGLGVDLVPLSSMLGLFLEAAVHGYDSPAHVADNLGGEDKITFTPRLVLGLKAMFGDILPPPPPPPPAIIPPPPPPIIPPPPPPAVVTTDISVCVIQGGMLQNVTVQYNTQTGDTTSNGTAFATAFPTDANYAAGASWYINNETIRFGDRNYVKYGLPRVLGVNEVSRAGEFQDVGVYTETGATGAPDVIYIPVRPGCEFQPYQAEIKTGGVRG